MKVLYTILLILFVAIILVFCVQNSDRVDVEFLGWAMNVPLAILVVVVYVLGTLTGGTLNAFLRQSYRRARES